MNGARKVAPAIARFVGLPTFFLDHLDLVKVPAYVDAKTARKAGGFPLVLFSHGWKGFAAQNTVQALTLASHGFVVVGLQHTYGAIITVFPDGSIAPNNPKALPDGAPQDVYEAAARILVDQWSGDLRYALDYMTSLDRETGSPFSNAIDLERVGVYGHSTGGGAAIQFGGSDARVKAVLGQDPYMRPVSREVLDRGIPEQAFFMFSQKWTDDARSRNNELFGKFLPNVPRSLGVISIDGTEHFDFSDLPLFSPLASELGLKGPISGVRVSRIVDDYLLSFFDETLLDERSTLFTGPSPYPEVKQRKF
jgi:dienelactone hydrolase